MDAIKKRFERFDKTIPCIWHEFKRMALFGKKQGFKRLSADHLIHEIRDRYMIHINNDYAALYSRKFLKMHRSCAGLFELRTRKHGRK